MDFKTLKTLIAEKHLTAAELKKREEIVRAMEKEHPGMDSTAAGMAKKMAIATAVAKRVAEESEQLDEVSVYNQVVTYYRHLGLDPYKLRGAVGSQLRARIKASPGFKAWLKVRNPMESVEAHNSLLEIIKSAKKDTASKGKGVDVTFYGYPDKNNIPSDSDKIEAKTDDNFINPN
jgi:hypothetical protein